MPLTKTDKEIGAAYFKSLEENPKRVWNDDSSTPLATVFPNRGKLSAGGEEINSIEQAVDKILREDRLEGQKLSESESLQKAIDDAEKQHEEKIMQAKAWMKKTKLSAEEAIKKFDLFDSDIEKLEKSREEEKV